jgi:hypothetical protein
VAAPLVRAPPGRVVGVAVRLAFSPPAFWYISSASTTASGSGARSNAARAAAALAWSRCRNASRWQREQESSRDIPAVLSPLATPRSTSTIRLGRLGVPASGVPVNALNTRPQDEHW